MANLQQSYLENAVKAADPKTLVLMLYDKGIQELNLAKKSIQEKKVYEKCVHIDKAMQIILELYYSLDMDKGQDAAEFLSRLYPYLLERLLEANLHSNIAFIDEVLDLFRPLRDTWKQVVCAPKNISSPLTPPPQRAQTTTKLSITG